MKHFDDQITITDEAVKQIVLAAIAEKSFPVAIRIGVKGGGCSGFTFLLDFTDEVDPEEDMIEQLSPELKLVIDELSIQYLKNVTIDYVTSLQQSGFKFDIPSAKKYCGCGSSFSV